MLGAASNSFVLFGVVFAVGIWRKWPLLIVFGGAALIHITLDFPLHADDAHRHIWPLSDWRFVSSVSYWDPDANGLIGSALETLMSLGAAAILWRRFPRSLWRLLIIGLALSQALVFSAQLVWTY